MIMHRRTAKDVFDDWALDYHADGMEKSHWQSVQEAFQIIPDSDGNYLEIGFGNGYGIKYLATHQYKTGQCYGLDISPNMVQKASQTVSDLKNVHLEAGDFLTWTPRKNIQFSCIFSMEVFYYFEDIRKGIIKASSLLKPNGRLMVLVNHYLENPESHTWPGDLNTPMALWSRKDYLKGFQSAGFRDIHQCRLDQKSNLPGTLCTVGIK